MRKFILLSALVIVLSSCAAMIQDMCTPNAAYSAGINDAQNSRNMQQNYANLCIVSQRGRINGAYRGGYIYGMRHRIPDPHWHHHYWTPYPWWHPYHQRWWHRR